MSKPTDPRVEIEYRVLFRFYKILPFLIIKND